MNKTFKTCLIASFLCVMLASCSGAAFFIGISIGKSQIDDTERTTTQQEGSTQIKETPVYYDQNASQRYLDENSPSDVYQKLIQGAQNHFSFEFQVEDQLQFANDKDFILANLENQYSRLSVKFNTEVSKKIRIKLVDDLEVFQEDLNTMLVGSGITTYSAFALGSDLIEIYVNPFYTTEKFELAHTLSHELVHIFQYKVNDQISSYNASWAYANWFIEGMAESFAYPNEEAIIHGDAYQIIPDTSALNDLITSNDSSEYMIGYDAVKLFFLYLSDTYGENKMIEITKCTTNFDQCFNQIIDTDPDVAYTKWIETL